MIFRDRVRETSGSDGSGNLSLEGAITGHRTFIAAFGDGAEEVPYCIELGTQWEVGLGELTDDPVPTLIRTTVLRSSDGTTAVDFSPGIKNIFSPVPAEFLNSIGGSAPALDDLTDVDAAAPADQDVLTWDDGAGEWIAQAAPGAGLSAGSLVSSPLIHVEADAGLTGLSDGDPVTTWEDQGANGLDFTQSTGANKPTYRANDPEDGLACVEFDGSNDYLTAIRGAGALTGKFWTVYMVAQIKPGGAFTLLSSVSGAADEAAVGGLAVIHTNNPCFPSFRLHGSASPSTSGPGMRGTLWTPLCLRTGPERMSRFLVSLFFGPHAEQCFQFDYGAIGSFDNVVADRWRIGARFAGGGAPDHYATCKLRAVLVYQAAHSDRQVREALKYLANKWT